ncbi:hypothetical protein ACRBEV_24920 [Methylobacterium phyllosphaerae]
MPEWNHPRKIHAKWIAPTSPAFPLDWQPEPSDFDDLLANMIEAACLLIRRRDGQLRAHNTLSGLTAYSPSGSKPLGEMSADALALLVDELRAKAAKARAMAAIEAEIQAAE